MSATVVSDSCEVSARFGVANGSTVGCSACDYTGTGDRVLEEDGIFIELTFEDLCGNGVLDPGEDCDLGATNGSDGSCCSRLCAFRSSEVVCRAQNGECDVAETCSGAASACPEDAKTEAETPCSTDDNVCTDDVCDGEGSCRHIPVLARSCGDDLVCNGQELCSDEGLCDNIIGSPCLDLCDEVTDTCITATATPGDAPTPTATPDDGACTGDCNGDGSVGINELVLGVNIGLGRQDASACRLFDRNLDGSVAINELIAGVRSALDGCV